MSADSQASRELELYIENDGTLYRQQHEPILKNLVDAGAKKYCKDFGGTWNVMFTVATRKKVAESLNESFLTEYSHGSYSSLLPKKYQK